MVPASIELLATGDELLDGSVVDSNSPWLMGLLFERGLPVWRKTIVGDDRDHLIAALREAAARSAVVVVSGGLGPTSDDLTAECAAEAAGVALRFDPPTYAALETRLRARGLAVSPNNRRQAMVPEGSTAIANRFGTAPMIALAVGRAQFYFLPGVPREYRGLCLEELLPRLESLAAAEPCRQVVLRCYGLPESQIDARLADLPQVFPGLKLGYRTLLPENQAKLRVVGAAALAQLPTIVAEARGRLGLDCFGEDDTSFSQAVGTVLQQAGASVALAESLTAGRAAALLAETPGASAYLRGGFVAYGASAKVELGVAPELIAARGVVSAAVAEAMAAEARRRLDSTFGLACTGWAGPTAGAGQPVGTVFTAVVGPAGARSMGHSFAGDRERIREFAAYATLDGLRRQLLTPP